MAKESKKSDYSGKDITVLGGLKGVRKRPAMYIGSTSKEGLRHLVYEVVDNSVDENLAGYCDEIKVIIHKDNSATVEDNGRGIPVEKNKKHGKSALELVMTKLHAGGKFEHKAYAISGGLHGVGVSVVNALSKDLTIEVKRNSNKYRQKYSRGIRKSALKKVGNGNGTGTKIHFVPDNEIFSEIEFDFDTLSTRFREIAFLNAGLKIKLSHEGEGKKETFHYNGGLEEFVKWLNEGKEILHKKPVYFRKKSDSIVIDVAVQYTNSYKSNIFGFVNTINTVEGGTHISGFKIALTRAVKKYAEQEGILKKGTLTGSDVREGLTAIVSVKIPEPQFEGQTKTKLGNSKVKSLVSSFLSPALSEFLAENPKIAKKITKKAIESAKAREAAKEAKNLVRRKSKLSVSGLPGKLSDCSSKKMEKSEMYIVEGDSAGGSAKQARDKETQAILPIKGKVLNVEKAAPSKILASEEISNLITVMGTGVRDEFDIEKLRYSKNIIMCDADVDGHHIKTLLLTFFYRTLPELIENGHVYIAVSPLYRVRKKNKDYYVYSKEELDKLREKIKGKVQVTRFKGLGEMTPTQLWNTTMNPKTRKLRKVTIDDAVEADRVFTKLMGKEVGPRKKFIKEKAKKAMIDV